MEKKRIRSCLYTCGKFGRGFREIQDTKNPNLYSFGRYPTKITADDLPEDYLKINSRAIWYMDGYIKTSGVKDVKYSWVKENHLFKDDYIYLSYDRPIKTVTNEYGFVDYTDYDLCICGNDIPQIVLWIEYYSKIDTDEVRSGIESKRVWLRDHEPDYYEDFVEEDRDIFALWMEKGYIYAPKKP